MTELLIPKKSDYKGIASKVVEELKTRNEIDLRVFISLEWGVISPTSTLIDWTAGELRKIKGLTLISAGNSDENTFIVSKKSWSDRNPVWDKVRTGFITALFSLIVGAILFQIQNRSKVQLDNQQDLRLKHLSDSLKILENHLRDSMKIVTRHLPLNP